MAAAHAIDGGGRTARVRSRARGNGRGRATIPPQKRWREGLATRSSLAMCGGLIRLTTDNVWLVSDPRLQPVILSIKTLDGRADVVVAVVGLLSVVRRWWRHVVAKMMISGGKGTVNGGDWGTSSRSTCTCIDGSCRRWVIHAAYRVGCITGNYIGIGVRWRYRCSYSFYCLGWIKRYSYLFYFILSNQEIGSFRPPLPLSTSHTPCIFNMWY